MKMLELTKKNIHMDCIKAKAGNQITIEDDVNIPDLRPDIDKVIFQSGVIRLEEVKPGNDQVAKGFFSSSYSLSERRRGGAV